MQVGDIVIYKQYDGDIPLGGTNTHPAIVTRVHLDGSLDLIVFFSRCVPIPAIQVPPGTSMDDNACYWPRLTDKQPSEKDDG